MFITAYTNAEGDIQERPGLLFLGRSGLGWCEPEEDDMTLMPDGASLVMMPGHYPVGVTREGDIQLLEKNRRGECAVALAALLPQGFTRTLLPAAAAPEGTDEIPLLGYTAVAMQNNKMFVAAVQTDEHRKWHPGQYNTIQLPDLIRAKCDIYPKNRILKQLSHCSRDYSCFTAQNIFYERWEGGIPTTPSCNAKCMGCISRSHTSVQSPQNRLDFIPEVDEIVEVGLEHLEKAPEGIVSFGQGCEGEPALSADRIADAIKVMRQKTGQGSININTNAGFTEGIKRVVDAGLDSMRVTLLSAKQKDYEKYHQPKGYKFTDVEESIKYAVDNGVYVSLNLLTIPGYTDSEQQVDLILKLAKRTGLQMIQFRNLNIDPNIFFSKIKINSESLGIVNMIDILEENDLCIGSYTRPVKRGE
ncbi:MAG: radical SAM protein [Candidatus Saccharibacteria bacterium]